MSGSRASPAPRGRLSAWSGLDVDGVLDLARGFDGLYFETGQGSEVTNGAAEGVDMVTLEARTYGVARHIRRRVRAGRWMIVNDVAGFIGPEVFRNAEQLERACLEDTVMAKLHGLTMGLDVCATFHMGIAPSALRRLTARIVERAAPAYLMSVAGNADPMLGYLTTSFREHPRLRRRVGRDMTSPMERRLTALGVLGSGWRAAAVGRNRRTSLCGVRQGRRRSAHRRRHSKKKDAERLHRLRERGFDLGTPDAAGGRRANRGYLHARARRAVCHRRRRRDQRCATTGPSRVRTTASSRDDYLAHPPAGERLRDEDARAVAALYPTRQPQVQLVVSDGLNANAINEQLRLLLPPPPAAGRRRMPRRRADIVVQNGRVRAGYEIGGLVGAAIVVHVIGERPGTGLNTVSAYLTYGRDERGRCAGAGRSITPPRPRSAASIRRASRRRQLRGNRARCRTNHRTAQIRRCTDGIMWCAA